MLLTEVHDSFDGDTHFPEFDDEWVEVEREERDGFAFVTYERG
jgi:dihydrofolate reductase